MKLLLALLLAAYWGGTTPVFEAINVNTARKVLNTSVLLRMKTEKDENGRRHYGGCSGTYIDPSHILTAAHCFTGHKVEFIFVRGPNDGIGYPAHLVKMSIPHDLALLSVPYANHPYARLGGHSKIGQTVINVGSPYNFEFVVSEGIIGAFGYKVPGFTSTYTITTAMINPGSSGGGAFNAKGELIGVNTMTVGMFGWTGITLTVSTNDVRTFLGV